MALERARSCVRNRVDQLPLGVWDCEGCGGTDSMQIRRSSLRGRPCADDVTLKCAACYRIRTHGIPIDRETYEIELEDRDGRTLDFVEHGPDSVDANLQSLGYVEY